MRVTLLPLIALALLSFGVAAQDKPVDESKLKVPADLPGWISYIDKKWDSAKDDEVATVKICARNLKDAVAKDEDAKRRFLKKFAGFKEIEATRAMNAALVGAKVDGKSLQKELATMRAAANTAIQDAKYTERDGGKFQPEVDKVVQPLLELWRDAVSYCVKNRKLDIKTPATKIDALAAMLADIESSTGGWSDGVKDAEAWMTIKGNELLAIKVADYEKAKKTLEENEKIKDDAFDDESKKHVRIVNDYRLALGRPVVAVSLTLCKACMSHAKWMDTNNKLGHDFPGHPDGKSPNDRATKAGFGGKVSENVTGAKDAQNAFDKWYKAAEHHRNMVRNGHAVVGIGHAGDKWCENFSSESE